MNKTIYIAISIILLSLMSCKQEQTVDNKTVENTKDNIVFAVPFAPVSYPILKMIEDGTFQKGEKTLEFLIWNTPDQLKSMVAGRQADIFATPSNVAAMFYNKGLDVKLLNISIWRAIWLVSRSDDKQTLEDFKGESITMPFKGDMPHIVFMALAKKQGLDPEKDFKLEYVPSPMDAAQKMIMRRADHALLIDPAVSTVIEKSKSGAVSIIAPEIYRSVDIQNEWGRLFNTANEIPFAGIMGGGDVLSDTALLKSFVEEYQKAAEWCMQHPEETAKIVVKYIPQLNQKGVQEAMRHVTLRADDALKSKTRLTDFFKVLYESKPELIGGKIPDDAFYFKQETDSVSIDQ